MFATVQRTTQEALKALAAATHPRRAEEDRSFHDMVSNEFDAWVETLEVVDGNPVYKDARLLDGLPAGWTPRARVVQEPRDKWSNQVTSYLVNREAGGWMLVHHRVSPVMGGNRDSLLSEMEPTLAQMYATVCVYADSTRRLFAEWPAREQMMRSFIAEHYNLDDPTEAAEATLVALGAQPQLMPAALARGDVRA